MMNMIILMLIIGLLIMSPGGSIGMFLGLVSCWFMFGESGRKSIRQHLTYWSWWDFRV